MMPYIRPQAGFTRIITSCHMHVLHVMVTDLNERYFKAHIHIQGGIIIIRCCNSATPTLRSRRAERNSHLKAIFDFGRSLEVKGHL